TKADVADRLGKLDLPGSMLEYLLAKFDLDRVRKTQRPSKADFLNWYKLDLIPVDTLRAELRLDGYNDYYIDNYLKQVAAV
ncbi:unnamed protein product, partial [marine sediment metagenome]